MNFTRQRLFASLWWQLSLSFLGIATLSVGAVLLASGAVIDAQRGFRAVTEVDMPRLNVASDMAEAAMRLVTLRNAVDDEGHLPHQTIGTYRQQLDALLDIPEFADKAQSMDAELQDLWQLSAELEHARGAQDRALTELRWLNIDLEGELLPLREDLRFDIELAASRNKASDIGRQFRLHDMLQDIDATCGALVTLLFQAATTEDREAFLTLEQLVDDSAQSLGTLTTQLPDRSDFLTLHQALDSLADQVDSTDGLMAQRLAYLDLRSRLQAQFLRLQRSSETLHRDLLARAGQERDEVFQQTENRAKSARLRLFWIGGIGLGLVLALFAVLFGHYRRGVVHPLVQMSQALRRISAGDTVVAIPASSGNEIGQMADAVRGFAASVDERERINGLLQHEVEEHKATLDQLKNAQADLVQAAKLATLGELSAGLNHELNQPLMSIQYKLHTLQDILTETPTPLEDARTRVVHLQDLTRRMISTVQHLKRFSRKPEPGHRAPVSVTQAIHGADSLIRYRLRNSGVSLEVADGIDNLSVLGDAGLVEQILLNLFSNSLEAIEERETPTGGLIRVSAERADGTVDIVVTDNGTGLRDLTPEDAMQPFVTGKPPGRGLGLGLSLSRKIAEELGGTLMLKPAQGAGTIAVLKLPETVDG